MRALIADAVASTIPPKPGYPIGSFPKQCGACGAVYTAAGWAQLPDRALWDMRPEGDLLDQRRCPCGSHICVTLEG